MGEGLFRLRLLSPDRNFFDGDVSEIIFQSIEGRIGIMAGHSPMIVSLAEGIIEILIDNEWQFAAVSQGFAVIEYNIAEFYLDSVEWSDEIDVSRAKAALERAESKLESGSNNDMVRAHEAMSRAMARLKASNIRVSPDKSKP